MSAALEFIYGRAGSGKTCAIFSRIKDLRQGGDGSQSILIVPDQETFETERQLSEYLGGGLFGVSVTSWGDLSRRVLDGLGERKAFLSTQGRVMLLRRCVDFCSKDLTVFKKSALYSGFPSECDELIKRFKRCGLSAPDVAEAADKLESGLPLRDKLRDVSVIFSDLERRCAERYIDSEDMMNEMIRRVAETPLKGSHIFIDGGSTVNEQSYNAFAALLENASSVCVAIDMDFTSKDRELFFPNRLIFERLCDIASSAGVSYTVTELSGGRRDGNPAIRHIERELFAFPQTPFDGSPDGLSISICADRVDEVTEAAEGILRAVSSGMRYRDIAVAVSDISSYELTVSRVFKAYGIPYLTDIKKRLITHPAAQLIISALKAVETGFGTEHITAVMRSGFMDVTADEAEKFENFIVSRGYFGSRLLSAFTDNDAEFEDIRSRLMMPLLRFAEALKDGNCESRTVAIHGFMEDLSIYDKQRELCAQLHERGLFRDEAENAQIVNTITEVLDQLYVIMGDERIGLKRFTAVVSEGFSSYEVGVIPTTCDQVLVGSIDRTRAGAVRLLYVLGMNDGLFPKPRKDDGVINDGDLNLLREFGYELWQNSKTLSANDMLTIYSMLSQASEQIVFSYPISVAGSAEGSSALPCRLIESIKRILPGIRVNDYAAEPSLRRNEASAFASLFRRLRRMLDTGAEDEEAARLFAYFSRQPLYRNRLQKLAAHGFGEEAIPPFGIELSRKLYGNMIYGSASRLEDFNKCPFLHYIRYGFGAKPRRERRMNALDKGSFRHSALEAYVRYVMENELDWQKIDDERVFEILREIIPPIMNREDSGLLFDTARQRAELVGVIESIKFTCCALTRHIAAGDFRPVGCEVSFGRPESLFPPLTISTGSGVTFRIAGVIDRIDSCKNSTGSDMSRIIDYKSGGKDFRFGYLNAGLQLQLPLYAAAVEAADTVGMYYMPVMDAPPVSTDTGEAVKRMTDELIKQFRLNGLSLRDEEVISATDSFDKASTVINAKRDKEGNAVGSGFVDKEEYRLVIETARKRAASALERIYEGEIDAHPYMNSVSKNEKACTYCDYKDICRFDDELSNSGYRKIVPMSADAFFGRTGKG